MSEPVRVVLVDPHHGMRMAMRWLLNDEAGIAVVGEGADQAAVQHAVIAGGVDVVVADERVAGMASEAARTGLDGLSSIASVVVTGTGEACMYTAPYRAAGAAGYWCKLDATDGLGEVIRAAAAARGVPRRVLHAPTDREEQGAPEGLLIRPGSFRPSRG
jgi:DNA-binding NarL/FixJ family response regulator